MQLAEKLGRPFCVWSGKSTLAWSKNQAKERMGKGKGKFFLLGFSLPKREYQNNFSLMMKGEILQAGSYTAQRELIL